MKNPINAKTVDGLEWLRTVRTDLQREISANPQKRAAYYQAKESELRHRMRKEQPAPAEVG